MGLYADAEPLLRAGLDRDRADLDPQSPFLLATIDRLGGLLDSLGKLQEAEALLREALDLRLERLGKEHSDTGAASRNLAANLLAQGRLDEAEAAARQAVDIQRNLDVDNPARLASQLHGLGRVMQFKGDVAQARELYNEALYIRGEPPEQSAQSAHSTARIRFHLAEIAEDADDTTTAEAAYAELVPIFDERLYSGHPDIANLRIALGRVRCRNSSGAQGMQLIKSARPMLERSLGSDNWQLVTVDVAIGQCLAQQGAFAEAEARLVASYELLRSILGRGHFSTVRLREQINEVYELWGLPTRAAE
jgi:tetratricopeptide (TPR) repeat protein